MRAQVNCYVCDLRSFGGFFTLEVTLHSSVLFSAELNMELLSTHVAGTLRNTKLMSSRHSRTYSLQLPSSCRALNEDITGSVAVDAQQTPCEVITRRTLATSWRLVSLNSFCLRCPSVGDRLLCEEHDPLKPPEAPGKLNIQEPEREINKKNLGILRIVQGLLTFQV